MELGVHYIDFLPGDPATPGPRSPPPPGPPSWAAETLCVPQPIRRPPVLIDGGGEKKTLLLVAQYADVWNATSTDVDELAHKIHVLHRHCDEVNRDPAEIRKTAGLFIDPFDGDSFPTKADQFAALGVDLVNVGPFPGNPDPVGFVQRLGDETIPKLAELG